MKFVIITSRERDLILRNYLEALNVFNSTPLDILKSFSSMSSSNPAFNTNAISEIQKELAKGLNGVNTDGLSASVKKSFDAIKDSLKGDSPFLSNLLSSFFSIFSPIEKKLKEEFNYRTYQSIVAYPTNLANIVFNALVRIIDLISKKTEISKGDIPNVNEDEAKKLITSEIKEILKELINNIIKYLTESLDSSKYKEYNVYLTAPVLNDYTLNVSTSYGDPSSLFGGAGAFLSSLANYYSALTGNYPIPANILKVPIWTSTTPVRLNLELIFYAKTDPLKDVLLPAMYLASLASIRIIGEEVIGDKLKVSFKVPGINLTNVGSSLTQFTQTDVNASKSGNSEELRKKLDSLNDKIFGDSGVVKIIIPGIIHLDQALIQSVNVTFSNNVTEDFLPVWAKVSMEVQSFFAARSVDLYSFLKEYLDNRPKNPTGIGGKIKRGAK